LLSRVEQTLIHLVPARIDPQGRARAGVLLLFYEVDGEPLLLFTRRTALVEHHKGQICFPGGAYEEDDGDLLRTALREAYEEVGVLPEHVKPIGQLHDIVSKGSNFVITPHVGLISGPVPYPFDHAQHEVEELLEVPLACLLDEANVTSEVHEFDGVAVTMPSYHYGDQIIWGATARILQQLLDLLK
jgi:8-oxo-dGTP pyrophosphatase MutT (NUDIX family)